MMVILNEYQDISKYGDKNDDEITYLIVVIRCDNCCLGITIQIHGNLYDGV